MDSESKLQESSSGARPVPVCVVSYSDGNDEISLVDLWRVIVVHKVLILLSLVVAILLASVYIFCTEPLYLAETLLLPPQQKDVQVLMIGKEVTGVKQYTPDLAYNAFLLNLKSKGSRREFFDAHNLADYYLADKPHTDADIDRIFDSAFNENLQVQSDKRDASFVVVKFVDTDPKIAAIRLNQFIAFAIDRTVSQLLNDVNATIQAAIERIQYQLTNKLELAEQKRLDKIVRLREAVRVADALGIESAGSSMETSREKTTIEVNTAQIPPYMRGTKVLEAEIEVLESRKSDEPFVGGLRDLQEKQGFLERLSINRDKLSVVTIDAAARTPYRAEKPRKKVVFILAVFLGLVVGVFLVFVAEFFSKARAKSD